MTSVEAVKAAHAAHVDHVDSTGGDYEGYCDDPELCPLMEPFAVALDAFRKDITDDRDRLRAILDHIAESAIVSHACLPSTPFAGCCQTTWGCGICNGASLGYDRPDGRGVYAHRDWCPRRP